MKKQIIIDYDEYIELERTKEAHERNMEVLKGTVSMPIKDYEIYKGLQQRIDKAIEYIKDKGCYEEDTKVFCDDINYDELSKLLNILQGNKEK